VFPFEEELSVSPIHKIVPVLLVIALPSCGQSASTVVQQIQEKAVAICSFLPSQQSVLEIVKATTNIDVAVIAGAICDAVLAWADKGEAPVGTPMMGLLAAPEGCPRVNGVCVSGTFVDKEGNPIGKPKEENPDG
jgi:hypothetical protein